MPRTLFLVETSSPTATGLVTIQGIDAVASRLSFAVKDAKTHKSFRLSRRVVNTRILFDILVSNLLTPFEVFTPLKAVLPIRKDAHGVWEQLPNSSVVAMSGAVQNTFNEIAHAISSGGTITDIFQRIDVRNKLSQQVISADGYLVLTGAGGSNVCSAYIPVANFDTNKLIIDQTLYWAQVDSEDEAIYLSGLMNSEAINRVIVDFQPRGSFGERHIHKLPFGVTPPYNEDEELHQNVVNATRVLIQEYQSLKQSNTELRALLHPSKGSLSYRRRKIVAFLKTLNSYDAYESACSALYSV